MFDKDNREQMIQTVGENGSGNQAAHDIYNVTNYYVLSNEEFRGIFNSTYGVIKQDTVKINQDITKIKPYTVNDDLSYEDIVGIFNNLFEKNFYRMSNEAKEIADSRCEELITKFFTILYFQNPSGFSQARDPDFLYDFFIAQRDYARCGDPILSNMLVRLLIERTRETERSRSQIVLNESIKVASKLTKEEIDTLTVAFVIKYHSKDHEYENIFELVNYITTYVLPFWNPIVNESSLRAHLIYTGCGSHYTLRNTDLKEFLKKYKDFHLEQLSNLKISIENENPRIKPFFDQFEDSIVNHMILTSAGIAIGYANLCNITGEEFNLSKWL